MQDHPVMLDHPSRGTRTPGPSHHANHPHQMPDYGNDIYQQPQQHSGMSEYKTSDDSISILHF